MLKISEIRINKINKGKFLGYASILIDNSLIIDGIEIYEGRNGRYILMPLSRNSNKDKRRNSAYPINEETRSKILEAISKKYDEDM